MPAYTPFLNLYKPGGGSSGTILPDEVADIDRLNANADLLDAFAASADSRLDLLDAGKGVGLVPVVNDKAARDLLFPAPVAGNRVYRLDTKAEEFYDAGDWWRADGRVVPAAGVGTGVTIDADGTIRFANSPANTYVGVNSVFTTRYKAYRIRYHISGGTSLNLRLTVGGVEVSNNTYLQSYAHVTGTAWVANSLTTNAAVLAPFASSLYSGEVEIYAPAEPGASTPWRGSAISLGVINEFGGTLGAAVHDGLRISTGVVFNGWMTIEGVA